MYIVPYLDFPHLQKYHMHLRDQIYNSFIHLFLHLLVEINNKKYYVWSFKQECGDFKKEQHPKIHSKNNESFIVPKNVSVILDKVKDKCC